MWRRSSLLWAVAAQSGAQYRDLNPGALLTVIRSEPGERAEYYARLYFGPGTEMKVKHFLWHDLKRYGHVSFERDAEEDPPRWYANRYTPPQAPQVRLYKAEDYDLSVLKGFEEDVKSSQEVDIEREIKDEQRRAQWGAAKAAASSTPSATPRVVQRKSSDWKDQLNQLASAAADAEELPASTPTPTPELSTPAAEATSAPTAESSVPSETADAPSSTSTETAAPATRRDQVRIELVRLVSLLPGQDMHSYVERLETEEDKTFAPSIFKELRTSRLFERSPKEGGEGGFVWHCTDPVK